LVTSNNLFKIAQTHPDVAPNYLSKYPQASNHLKKENTPHHLEKKPHKHLPNAFALPGSILKLTGTSAEKKRIFCKITFCFRNFHAQIIFSWKFDCGGRRITIAPALQIRYADWISFLVVATGFTSFGHHTSDWLMPHAVRSNSPCCIYRAAVLRTSYVREEWRWDLLLASFSGAWVCEHKVSAIHILIQYSPNSRASVSSMASPSEVHRLSPASVRHSVPCEEGCL